MSSETVELVLEAARNRGKQSLSGFIIPQGLDHFTAYVGLIGSALELGKLIRTERRDLHVIDSHYQIEVTRIEAAFGEIELAMMADFKKDESLKQKTFEAITQLITAGQYEIASEFHRRFMESLGRTSLDAIIEGRNNFGSGFTKLNRT